MHTLRDIVRRGMLYVLALVLVAGYPLTAMADTQEPTTEPVPVTAPVEETPPAEPEKPPLTYTFNPDTQKWDSEDWRFNPATNSYEKPPAPIIIEPEVKDEGEKTVDKTVDTKVTIDNKVLSDALSGDALVSGNSSAGSALSGDASAVANIINSVNSTISTDANQKVATFTKDIYGDVKGDIVLYPLLLKAMLEAKANEGTSAPTSTTVNASTDLGINNTVDLKAKTGNATVDSNTNAGDATSGNAVAMANVVNILNSMIAAQGSFIGTINIYGNLDGDVLVAPDFIPQMIANNGGSSDSSATKLSTQDTTTIVNNITAVADSGAAAVLGNTNAGSATSGDADSNIVIFNVTGHDIVAENSMLVFVNVLGKWVGMIVDAPQGATAAMLATGVTKNEQYAPDLTVNAQTKHGITNTIAVSAETGDAVVSNNTTGGNATSGNAKAIANVANVSGTQLRLSGWSQVLFINVLGDWCGSFGIDTSCGGFSTQPLVAAAPTPTGPIQFVPEPQNVPASSSSGARFKLIDSRTVQAEKETEAATEALFASAASPKVLHSNDTPKPAASEEEPVDYRLWLVAGSLFLVGASAMGIRRILQS